MTRIDFYVLGDAASQACQRFACRLASKAYGLGHKVYLHVDSAGEAQLLDELLWSFSDRGFVPHALWPPPNLQEPAPVLVGHGSEAPADAELLINLGSEVPLFFSRFDRVAELVCQEETSLRRGRERFRFYRDRGYHLESHDIASGTPR
jgi:DNA polymerase-3 subunit chi